MLLHARVVHYHLLVVVQHLARCVVLLLHVSRAAGHASNIVIVLNQQPSVPFELLTHPIHDCLYYPPVLLHPILLNI